MYSLICLTLLIYWGKKETPNLDFLGWIQGLRNTIDICLISKEGTEVYVYTGVHRHIYVFVYIPKCKYKCIYMHTYT